MSITDELRKYVQDWRETPNLMDDLDAGDIDALLGDFEHIADLIDAEHEAMLEDARKYVYEGYVELPVDADGEYIHVGDVMAYADNTKPMEVVALVPPAVFLTEDGPRYADMCRHYHAPTVEDVLRDYASRILIAGCIDEEDELVAEYAKRLKLAGDEE